MVAQFYLAAAIGLTPVLVFLGVLYHFDSYRLTRFGEITQMLVAGALLGAVALVVNSYLLRRFTIDFSIYSRLAAPLVEECLKATIVVFLFARNRIGFMIDATIMGFAAGTGFSLFENIYYLHVLRDPDIGVWIIRGFGTAIMHGGATAMFALLLQRSMERVGKLSPAYFLYGLVAASGIHGLYNALAGAPLLAAVAILVCLPCLFLLVFSKSTFAVHQWLVDDYKSHQELLDEINSGRFTDSEAGRFMVTLTSRFDPAVVADMFEYLKLHVQLVLQAEKLSLAHEERRNVDAPFQVRQDLLRLHVLEKGIGRVALMALWPHLHFSRRELWELHALNHAAGRLPGRKS